MADGAPDELAQDVTLPGCRRADPRGRNRQRRPQMVGHDAQRICGGLVELARRHVERLGDDLEQAGQLVGLPHGRMAIEEHGDALEAHAGVDVALLELREHTALVPVVAHEDVVPHLDVLGDVGERLGLTLAHPQEHLGVGTARTGRPVRPPVVVLTERVDAPGRIDARVAEHLAPDLRRLCVGRNLIAATEHGDVQAARVDAEVLGQQLERLGDRRLLEVVAKAPVAEHLEHGEVAVVADLIDVRGAHAALHVAEPVPGGVRLTEQVRGDWMHPGRREQHVVGRRPHRVALDHDMAALDHEVEEALCDLLHGPGHRGSLLVITVQRAAARPWVDRGGGERI